MAARLIGEFIIGLLIFAAILYGTFRLTQSGSRPPAPAPPELDVSRTPSEWFTDSRTTADGDNTEVCVVRVETKTGLVRERRVLRTLDNDAPEYKDQLEKAMDDAYETMRILNVNLRRR